MAVPFVSAGIARRDCAELQSEVALVKVTGPAAGPVPVNRCPGGPLVYHLRSQSLPSYECCAPGNLRFDIATVPPEAQSPFPRAVPVGLDGA